MIIIYLPNAIDVDRYQIFTLITYPQIHFELLDKNKNHYFDFVEIAELIFKQLGLFE